MSGILDQKSRIVDVILTQEGRRQLASGLLEIAHATFTDGSTYYDREAVTGSFDATRRPSFEACCMPRDLVTRLVDDSGALVSFPLSGTNEIVNGKFFSNVNSAAQQITGSNFFSTANIVVSSSLDSFVEQRVIASRNELFDEDSFDFTLAANKAGKIVYLNADDSVTQIENHQKLYEDPKLSHIKNFMFLPPVNKRDSADQTLQSSKGPVQNLLGDYQNLNGVERLTFDDVECEMKRTMAVDRNNVVKVKFDSTSIRNNLMSQFFELSGDTMRKLDVIDFGHIRTQESTSAISHHVFFVGKIERDAAGVPSFFHIFTLVFS